MRANGSYQSQFARNDRIPPSPCSGSKLQIDPGKQTDRKNAKHNTSNICLPELAVGLLKLDNTQRTFEFCHTLRTYILSLPEEQTQKINYLYTYFYVFPRNIQNDHPTNHCKKCTRKPTPKTPQELN